MIQDAKSFSLDSDPLSGQGRAQEHCDSLIVRKLKEEIGLKQLVGESPVFLREVKKIPIIAQCDASVLISGETGTGKEICARAIHYLSSRSGRPFVPVSCGAIPAELVENELFGHVRGAYTGADSSQQGLIHESDGGTLFLDEIDCLPLPVQAKLLRFLQEKDYRMLGSTKICRADTRVIASTNVDLEQSVRQGGFRRDLYYRINIVPLFMPPLRDRRSDIPLLAEHFLFEYSTEFRKQVRGFTQEARRKLLMYDWPGNVRELENTVERAVVFCEEDIILDSEIVLPSAENASFRESFRTAKSTAIGQFEKDYIEKLLLACSGNISHAAKAAKKNRRAFWELIRKYKIDVRSFKLGAPKNPDNHPHSL
ncbi:MAG: sigma-54 dependent transcriptional regulator [Nitrospirota bacterium]